MKKHVTFKSLLIAAGFSLIGATTFAQWIDISTGYSNVELFDVKFVNDNNGYAVGRNHTTNFGYIFKTTDGGSNWTVDSVANTFFRAVAMADINTGCVGGYDDVPASTEVIHKTTDAGANWTLEANTIAYYGIEHMMFVNTTTGYATGYGDTFGWSIGVYKTTDAGATWTAVSNMASTIGGDFDFTSATNAYMITHTGASAGTVQKSIDGGVNWTLSYSGNWMKDVDFVSTTIGYALEGLSTCNLIKTTTAGASWSTVGAVGTANTFTFVNQEIGFTVGDGGVVYKTVNGGGNWTTETSNTTNNLNEVTYSAGYVYACGDQGTVIRTPHSVVSVDERSFDLQVSLSPNPTTGVVNLNLGSVNLNGVSVSIYNMVGQKMSTLPIINNATNMTIDLSGYNNGIYFVEIISGIEKKTIKVVKQ